MIKVISYTRHNHNYSYYFSMRIRLLFQSGIYFVQRLHGCGYYSKIASLYMYMLCYEAI